MFCEVCFISVSKSIVTYETCLCIDMIQITSSGIAALSQSDCVDVLFAHQLAPLTNLLERLSSPLHWHKVMVLTMPHFVVDISFCKF